MFHSVRRTGLLIVLLSNAYLDHGALIHKDDGKMITVQIR
jgi:hypothetical protein